MKRILIIFVLLLMPINIFAYSDKIIPGGNTLGIEVKNDGVIVIGFYKVNGKFNKNDFKVGDVIVQVSETNVASSDDLVRLIEENIKDDSEDIGNGQSIEVAVHLLQALVLD